MTWAEIIVMYAVVGLLWLAVTGAWVDVAWMVLGN